MFYFIFILFYFILFYFILFYFILFYFILFYLFFNVCLFVCFFRVTSAPGALPKIMWRVCAATLTPIFKPPVTEWPLLMTPIFKMLSHLMIPFF